MWLKEKSGVTSKLMVELSTDWEVQRNAGWEWEVIFALAEFIWSFPVRNWPLGSREAPGWKQGFESYQDTASI